jgi:pectin methylesterase-like acyl-CoA thioesterase
MRFSPLICWLIILILPLAASAGDVVVSQGESIQKAIDSAASGSVIKIAAGVFHERLSIDKPVTLQGAGWDKTIIEADAGAGSLRCTEAGICDSDRIDGRSE